MILIIFWVLFILCICNMCVFICVVIVVRVRLFVSFWLIGLFIICLIMVLWDMLMSKGLFKWWNLGKFVNSW